MKNDLLISGEQLETQEEGVKGEALHWESGRVMFIFKIFTQSERISFQFYAKIYHSVFLGAGSYKKCEVIEC